MGKLSELRQKSKITRELQEQRVSRIQNAVTEVVNNSAFTLTVLNHTDDVETEEKRQSFINTVATHVTEAVIDPKIEFLDACRARGLSERKIEKAVNAINEIFNLTDSDRYEEKVEAVALYLQKNNNLYEDIALLT